MDLSAFANPWEHVRLLSDGARTRGLVGLLRRHAPGARVLEVGCGTGLLSCVAARLGAKRVHAVEATPLAELARELVGRNDLGGVVEVIEGRIEALSPRPVDFAFSELLNADPFAEGLLPAMRAARRWAGREGRLAPRRLRVHCALVAARDSAKEVSEALTVTCGLADAFDLRLEPLLDALRPEEPYIFLAPGEAPVSTAATAWDLALGTPDDPDDEIEVEVEALQDGPVAGAVCWFEAEYDEALTLGNPPGAAGHWGQLVCGWAEAVEVRAGERVRLALTLEDDAVAIRRG